MNDALCEEFGVLARDLAIMRHYLEDFLVCFIRRHHRDQAVFQEGIRTGGLWLDLRPWHLTTHDVHTLMDFHVILDLEGVPIHAWTEEVIDKIVGKFCSLHVEEASLNVRAWAHKSNLIEAIDRLTLCDAHTETTTFYVVHVTLLVRPSWSLCCWVIMHLDVVEDYRSSTLQG